MYELQVEIESHNVAHCRQSLTSSLVPPRPLNWPFPVLDPVILEKDLPQGSPPQCSPHPLAQQMFVVLLSKKAAPTPPYAGQLDAPLTPALHLHSTFTVGVGAGAYEDEYEGVYAAE
jgi:hypothetical protein